MIHKIHTEKRKMIINPEIQKRIIDTANSLVAEGIEEPTNALVLERMGKGSLSHVSPVMRQWRESRKAEVVAALEMPSALKKAIETSLSHMWMTASKMATVAVEQVRLDAEERVLVVTNERDEALAEIGRLESRVATLVETLSGKDAVISEGIGELEQEKSLHQKAIFENAALSTRLEDRDAYIKTLTEDMKTAREDYKQLQGELVTLAKSAKK